MSKIPVWDRQFAVWSNAAQMRQAELVRILSDLTTRGEETMSEVRAQAGEQVERARRRVEELPGAVLDELRRRLNVLDLATKTDVEAQSKLERKRVNAVAKEIRKTHHSRDQEMLRTLRAQLREELEIFAAAIADDLFSLDDPPPATSGDHTAFDDALDELATEDDIELVSYDDLRFAEDDDDLDGSGMEIRHSYTDATDE
jgi:hypothetical protein